MRREGLRDSTGNKALMLHIVNSGSISSIDMVPLVPRGVTPSTEADIIPEHSPLGSPKWEEEQNTLHQERYIGGQQARGKNASHGPLLGKYKQKDWRDTTAAPDSIPTTTYDALRIFKSDV